MEKYFKSFQDTKFITVAKMTCLRLRTFGVRFFDTIGNSMAKFTKGKRKSLAVVQTTDGQILDVLFTNV